MPKVAGLDIAKGRWARVELCWNDDGQPELVGDTVPYGELQIEEDWSLAVIDIPVGLLPDDEAAVSDKGRTGSRAVDRGARKWCSSNGSVSAPPTVGQLSSGMNEHRRAAASRGKGEQKRKLSAVRPGGLSKQAFELLPAIDDARQVKADHPDRVFESHPEAAFSVIATGVVPMSKKSLFGILMRAQLLSSRLGIDVLKWVLEKEGATKVVANDWLDAVVMALVAMDWVHHANQRKVLRDATGKVTDWDSRQVEQLMALPSTTLTTTPAKIDVQAARHGVLAWLANR